MRLNFFYRMGQWHSILELLIASVVLSVVLNLAEQQAWSKLSVWQIGTTALFFHWVLLVFMALHTLIKPAVQQRNACYRVIINFILLTLIIVLTTLGLNTLVYWGQSFSLQNISWQLLQQNLLLNCSYGVLFGALCLRYIYMRDEWLRQQNSELNAKLLALQARIHPHFLFNSLNSVVSLIAIDPDRAEQMLIDLSKVFRASFQSLKMVTLAEEIELCQHYLAVEQVRFAERLQIEWKIQQPNLLSQVRIPILTLQPLLENSIVHGAEQKIQHTKIGILVEILQNQVTIVITNPYIADKITTRESNGIALDNVKQRLKAQFGVHVQCRTHAGNGIFTTLIQYQYK